uniref:Matrix metalloproteinase-19-like n=1 Tax=Crassostrea virginica TaxID=6565 RepID=A0A8B8CLT9_CRAVI|nr:matrix metalloproteinase-19-like [Crassostrea virginica]
MSVRRCGNEKIYRADRRSRRNVNVWEKNKLTWGFEKFSRKFKRIIQWRIFQKVLRIWSRHSKLRFKYSRKNPDIRILFARYDHGDGYYNAFDGQGKVIGHAFRPSDGGTHFDDDEFWSLSSNLTNGQIHLPSVALHETGHALGLDHVNDFMSVMSAYYSKVKMTPSPVDIGQLNDLYGKSKKVEVSTGNSKPGLPGSIPPTKEGLGQALDGCRGISDLIILQNRKKRQILHIFAGNITFRVSSHGNELATPAWTPRLYPALPGNIEAASFYKKTQAQYFFKGDKVWKYNNRKLVSGYPKTVQMHKLLEEPRASLTLTTWHSSRILIFGNRTFWEWSPWRDDTTNSSPRLISQHWMGLPDNLDSAVQWEDQYVYFFKGSKYYKVHPSRRMVLPGYPAPMPPPWLRTFCQSY